MTAATDAAQEAQWKRWRAVADLYHAYFTGLILTVVTRRGTADAAEFVFRVFRRQQQERFLPGLEKLGLSHLPPAVAAAQYHYLSNWIGGVHVEYMYESDRKAWIRYPPPRWIWKGTAICGVPGEVSRAMLRGWHANNGVALGDLRLGFVCTKQSVDGQDGLEGYYHQYDHPLELDQRLVFARHLEAPLFDAKTAPALPVASWPKPRLEKAYRNYAMEYVRTAAPVMVQLFGPEDAGYLLHLTGKLIGMQYFDEVAAALSMSRGGAREFAAFLNALFAAQDDSAETTASVGTFEFRQQSWKLMDDVADYHRGCAKVLEGLFEGLAAGCGRHIRVHLRPTAGGRPPLVWTIE
ncbi:hypothetical protein ABIF63_001238 [Bradyrhizobium japonicum]|uniref:Uncharacterized protein n=1 Tax=Bradyrhizobium japonicum TaxID=375 RepID=A0ABV2RLJ5_BRAJP|nr:hypothetical protein [Bradyrhizobium japonicum]UQD99125.1 hypothetical protein JEY30_02215 [Bradyrhizobium japonicum]WLB19117.1 hypothetical protein QIH95_45640 [Bradyrhizobium japonicum]